MKPFNIYLHHGGTFYRTTRSISYIGGLVDMLFNVKLEEFSKVKISEYLNRYPGYHGQILKYWYIEPGKILGKGRKALDNDDDILIMCQIAQKSKFINVYVEHVEEQDFMEEALKQVLIDPNSEEDDEQAEFYHEDENGKHTKDDKKRTLGRKKKKKGKELVSEGVKEVIIRNENENVMPKETAVKIDERLDDVLVNDEHRKTCDVRDITFNVGMEFESIKDFKQVVSRLSLFKKGNLKFKAHSTDRASVFCSFMGCPWRVYASTDKRRENVKVRVYQHVHTCVHQGKTKRVTDKSAKLKQHARVITCQRCLETGHNIKGCPKKAKPKASRPNVGERRPRGRPKAKRVQSVMEVVDIETE